MDDSTRVIRGQRRPWPATARTAAVVIATTSLTLLAAACGGSPSAAGSGGASNTGGSTSSQSSSSEMLPFARCMRSNGVPKFPDPSSSGKFPGAQELGVSNSRYQEAERACRHLLPNSEFATSLDQCLMTGNCPSALVQRALTEGLKFAQCMRNHGVLNWPDPTIDATGRPSFQVSAAGISIASTRSPQMLSKIGHCQSQPGAVLLRQE